MALSREEYGKLTNKLSRLVWDITANVEFPNPYCEKELLDSVEACTKLLIQLKTYHKEIQPRRYGWWCPEIKKEGDHVKFFEETDTMS